MFKPGQSGNPAGKPPGTLGKVRREVRKMMADEWPDVVRSVVSNAKGGDMIAAKIILDRVAPSPRGRLIRLGLPPVASAQDVLAALNKLVEVMSRGIISAEEADSAAGVLELHRKAIETLELERRITAIEQAQKGR